MASGPGRTVKSAMARAAADASGAASVIGRGTPFWWHGWRFDGSLLYLRSPSAQLRLMPAGPCSTTR